MASGWFDNDKDLKQTDQDGSFLEVHNPKSQAAFVMVFPVKNDPNSWLILHVSGVWSFLSLRQKVGCFSDPPNNRNN